MTKLNKFTVTATIPTQQYGNIQPSIEVEASSVDEAKEFAMPHIEELWKKYGTKPLETNEEKRISGGRKLEKDIFGNEIYYDDNVHQYTNALGEIYMSGSTFASQSEAPFNAELISGKMAAKAGIGDDGAEQIRDMWRLKADASASFGTAIHAALELYGRFKPLADTIDKDTHIHDNPMLNKAVAMFYEEHPDVNNVHYEALVVDHSKKRAGRVDRLEIDANGDAYITDFKTNSDIKKSLKKYWLQLSFYAAIAEANGMKVRGLKIYHWNGEEWATIEHEVVNLGD